MALKKFCRKAGCKILTNGAYCDNHQQTPQEKDKQRGTSHERGYDHRWRKARASYLVKHPLCLHCEQKGVLSPAVDVDHIIPHRGDSKLFWDKENWQGLCKTHHSRKTQSGQ